MNDKCDNIAPKGFLGDEAKAIIEQLRASMGEGEDQVIVDEEKGLKRRLEASKRTTDAANEAFQNMKDQTLNYYRLYKKDSKGKTSAELLSMDKSNAKPKLKPLREAQRMVGVRTFMQGGESGTPGTMASVDNKLISAENQVLADVWDGLSPENRKILKSNVRPETNTKGDFTGERSNETNALNSGYRNGKTHGETDIDAPLDKLLRDIYERRGASNEKAFYEIAYSMGKKQGELIKSLKAAGSDPIERFVQSDTRAVILAGRTKWVKSVLEMTTHTEKELNAAWDRIKGGVYTSDARPDGASKIGGELNFRKNDPNDENEGDEIKRSEYRQKWGAYQDPLTEMMNNTARLAKQQVLVDTFGPNIRKGGALALEKYNAWLTENGAAPTEEYAATEARRFKRLIGGNRTPGNVKLSMIGGDFRALIGLKALGEVTLRSVPDMASGFYTIFRTHGITKVPNYLKNFLKHMSVEQQLDTAKHIGYVSDALNNRLAGGYNLGEMGTTLRQISADREAVGGSTRLIKHVQASFFRTIGLTWWTDLVRSATVASLAHGWGDVAEKAWSGLRWDQRDILTQYGIDEDGWNAIRSTELKNGVLLTQNIKSEAAQTAYQRMMVGESRHAVFQPGLADEMFILGGSTPGTWAGQGRALAGLFKGWSTAYLRGGFFPLITRSDMPAMIRAKRAVFLLGTMSSFTMAANYAVNELNRTPQPSVMSKNSFIESTIGTLAGSYLNSYIMTGNTTDPLGDALLNLFGPAYRLTKPFGKAVVNAMKGEGKKALSEASVGVVNALPSGTVPGIYWLRKALINQVIREGLNPGYLSRMKARQARESAQNQSLFGN